MKAEKLFSTEKIIGVIRSQDSEIAKEQFIVLAKAGLKMIEFSLMNDSSHELIQWAKQNFPNICVGAASILNLDQAIKVYRSSAPDFLVSPIFDKEIYDFAKENRILFIPGAFTATEIAKIINSTDLKFIKLFPASSVEVFQGIKKVFPNIQFMLSGFPVKQMRKFVKAGAHCFAIGSYFTENTRQTKARFDGVLRILKQYQTK